MRSFSVFAVKICALLLVVLVLNGCLSHNTPEVTYFSLMNMEQLGDNKTVANLPEIKLGVGPVEIPDSLKRSQLVTRSEDNRYTFDEFNRWAGELEQDIATVLGDNLGQLLGVDRVAFFPWMQHFKPSYRVVVTIQRLDGSLAGEAVLIARWAVTDAAGKQQLAAGKSDYRQPLEQSTFAALIKAESQLVAALSLEIAEGVMALK